MGLFDGGFDMDALASMLNPVSSAQAAPMAPDFNDRFNAARPGQGAPYEPPVGVSPPPTDGRGLEPPPPNNIMTLNRSAAVPMPMARPAGADVGAALNGDTAALTQPAVGPTSVGGAPLGPPPTPGPMDANAQAKAGETRPSLAQALKGVQAPPAPVLQKISSPNAPRPTGSIKGGDLQALLMALNAGVPALAGRQLPVTLGRG